MRLAWLALSAMVLLSACDPISGSSFQVSGSGRIGISN